MKYFNHFFTLALLSSVSLCQAMNIEGNASQKITKLQLKKKNNDFDSEKLNKKLQKRYEQKNVDEEIEILQTMLDVSESSNAFKSCYSSYLNKRIEREEKFGNNNNIINNDHNNFYHYQYAIKENNNNNNNIITKEVELEKKSQIKKDLSKDLVEHFLKNKDSRFNSCKTTEDGLKRLQELEKLGVPLTKEHQPPLIPTVTNEDYMNEISLFENDETSEFFALFQGKWYVINPDVFSTVLNVDYSKQVTYKEAYPNILSLNEFRNITKNNKNKENIVIEEMRKYAQTVEDYAKEKKLKGNDYLACYQMNGSKKKKEDEVEINFYRGDKSGAEINNLLNPGVLGVYLRNDKLYCKFKNMPEKEIKDNNPRKELEEKFVNFKNKLSKNQDILDDRAPIRRFIKEENYIPNEEEALKFTSKELLFLVYKSPEEKIENNNNQKIDINDKDDIENDKNIGWKSIPIKWANSLKDNFSAKKSVLTFMQNGDTKVKSDNSLNWRYQVESDHIVVNKKAKYKISYQIQMKEQDRTAIGLDLGVLKGDRKSYLFSSIFKNGRYNPERSEYSGEYILSNFEGQSKFSVIIYNSKQSNLTPEFTIKKLTVEEKENK